MCPTSLFEPAAKLPRTLDHRCNCSLPSCTLYPCSIFSIVPWSCSNRTANLCQQSTPCCACSLLLRSLTNHSGSSPLPFVLRPLRFVNLVRLQHVEFDIVGDSLPLGIDVFLPHVNPRLAFFVVLMKFSWLDIVVVSLLSPFQMFHNVPETRQDIIYNRGSSNQWVPFQVAATGSLIILSTATANQASTLPTVAHSIPSTHLVPWWSCTPRTPSTVVKAMWKGRRTGGRVC